MFFSYKYFINFIEIKIKQQNPLEIEVKFALEAMGIGNKLLGQNQHYIKNKGPFK